MSYITTIKGIIPLTFELLRKSGKLQKKEAMEVKRISLDLRDSSKTTRFFQIVFGVFCIAASIWFLNTLLTTGTISFSNSVAVIFLFLFGIWELLSGADITGKYLIISDESLTLKHKPFSKPVILKPGDLKKVVFKPVSFEVIKLNDQKVLIKLGLYYRERTVEIFESIEEFCKINQIPVEGLPNDNQ